jgi:uncharacterized membrane protein YgcG
LFEAAAAAALPPPPLGIPATARTGQAACNPVTAELCASNSREIKLASLRQAPRRQMGSTQASRKGRCYKVVNAATGYHREAFIRGTRSNSSSLQAPLQFAETEREREIGLKEIQSRPPAPVNAGAIRPNIVARDEKCAPRLGGAPVDFRPEAGREGGKGARSRVRDGGPSGGRGRGGGGGAN